MTLIPEGGCRAASLTELREMKQFSPLSLPYHSFQSARSGIWGSSPRTQLLSGLKCIKSLPWYLRIPMCKNFLNHVGKTRLKQLEKHTVTSVPPSRALISPGQVTQRYHAQGAAPNTEGIRTERRRVQTRCDNIKLFLERDIGKKPLFIFLLSFTHFHFLKVTNLHRM